MNLKFRHIVVLMMMTAMICSCERDAQQGGTEEPVPVPETGTPIVFTASRQQETAVTRATTPLKDYQTTFKVWGFKNYSYTDEGGTYSYGDVQTVFPGYTVEYAENSQSSTTTNTAGWEYILTSYPDQSIKFWDWAARAYRFFGVTDGADAILRGDRYEFSFTADTTKVDETPYYSRLWFSTGNYETYPDRQFGRPVELEFLKPFAQVRFLFVSGDPSVDLERLYIEDPVFGPITSSRGIAVKGEFKVSYPLTGSGTSETFTVVPDGAMGSVMDAFTVAERWYTVLPAPGQGPFRLTVTVAGDPDKECIVPAEYMNWQPSFKYTYIFKVNDEGGVELGGVLAAYTQWQDGGETEKKIFIFNW